ncbi:MAG: redox-sensing transcriptional repressor Rex [Candidatus Delongbacteria bacterium]|nr:redox-sensing transcriptional repressor Rex [Candidatus Delongbacteria bacterium]
MNSISQRTVERLSLYRRRLMIELAEKDYIFSHQLAKISNSTAAQVRRDLMHLGYTGVPRKGYKIKDLIKCISQFLDPVKIENVVIVGVGNLGKALLTFFKGRRPKLSLVACFDIDKTKVGTDIAEVPCYHLNEMPQKIKELKVNIGIISSTENATKAISEVMISAGIRSIINFTCYPLNISESDNVFLEQIDITASFEKAAYFSKLNINKK